MDRPFLIWQGEIISRRGRKSTYRVLVNPPLYYAPETLGLPPDPRAVVVEKMVPDHLGGESWVYVGTTPPRAILAVLAIELADREVTA